MVYYAGTDTVATDMFYFVDGYRIITMLCGEEAMKMNIPPMKPGDLTGFTSDKELTAKALKLAAQGNTAERNKELCSVCCFNKDNCTVCSDVERFVDENPCRCPECLEMETALNDGPSEAVRRLPFGIHMYELKDKQLILTGVNRESYDILGLDISKFIGQPIETIYPHLDETPMPAMYKRTASEGTEWSAEDSYDNDGVSGRFLISAFNMGKNKMMTMFKIVSDKSTNRKDDNGRKLVHAD